MKNIWIFVFIILIGLAAVVFLPRLTKRSSSNSDVSLIYDNSSTGRIITKQVSLPAPKEPTNEPDPFLQATKNKDATITIHWQNQSQQWRDSRGVILEPSEMLSLKVEPIPESSIRWYQIFPDITQRYNNAYWPNEPQAYQWKGIDEINYIREEIPEFRDQWTVSMFADSRFQYKLTKNKVTQSSFFNETAGSFWYQVEILHGNRLLRSPGIEDAASQGLNTDVLRVTLHLAGQDLIHHLAGFFNVPGIFGSTIHQSTNYIGVDCADVLMAAHAEWKKSPNEKNYNVAMLVDLFPKAAELELSGGTPNRQLSWNKDVRPGDFIAVRYQGGKSYQHIGALYKDNNGDGLLGPEDLVIHAGPDPLHLSRLKNGNFDGHIVILRPE